MTELFGWLWDVRGLLILLALDEGIDCIIVHVS
jgi:hypothetical protein